MTKHKATEIDRAIGKNMKILRTLTGYTQIQIAEFLGVTFQQVQKYESGKNRVSAATLYKLKQLYGVPYDLFFGKNDRMKNQVKKSPWSP